MDRETARGPAINALMWLTEHEQYLEDSPVLLGAKTNNLKLHLKELEFLSFVQDFFVTSDDLIVYLNQDLKIPPKHIQVAHSVLSSADWHQWA